MAFRIVESDGVIEFDTLEELTAYKQWKAHGGAVKAEPVQKQQVVVIHDQSHKPEPTVPIKRRRPALWKQQIHKRFTADEIAQVKAEFEKRGDFDHDDIRIVANKMGILKNRVHGIYYKHINKWRKQAPEPVKKHSPITAQQIDDMAQFIKSAEKSSSGHLVKGIMAKFGREHGIDKGRATTIRDIVHASGKLGEDSIKTERHRWLWKRIAAMQAQDKGASINKLYFRAQDEWETHGNLGRVHPEGEQQKVVQKKPQVSDKDLEFPAIYPLANGAVRIFEQMFIDLIAKKHAKIDYYLASASLQLTDGHEWGYREWISFCQQVLASAAQIARALVGCDSKKIRLQKVDRSLEIRYG